MDRVLKKLIHEAQDAEKYATDWEALDKIKRVPGITPDPSLQAWYAQLGKERRVAQRVFELIDIYRMTDDEKTCVLNCLKYHSNRQNLYPIKGNRG